MICIIITEKDIIKVQWITNNYKDLAILNSESKSGLIYRNQSIFKKKKVPEEDLWLPFD